MVRGEWERLIEWVLGAERFQLLHPSVGKAAFARRLICRGPSKEMLDRPTCAAGDDLERSHRGPGFSCFDEENGLARKVRPRQLRHAEAGGPAALPDERGIHPRPGKAPPWACFPIFVASLFFHPHF